MVELAPLDTDEISRGLNTRAFGRRLYHFVTVGSTNDIAKQLAKAGENQGALAIAEEQTAGRGRMARTWVAPPKSSILMSLVLRPRLSSSHLGRLGIAISLGVCEAVETITKLNVTLKWPNDVLLQGGKVAGVLTEAEIVGDEVEFAVVGIGINVNFAVATVKAIPQDATTISDVLGKMMPREPLVRLTLERCEHWHSLLQAGENPIAEWKKRCSTLGMPIHVITPGGHVDGIAHDVDDNGALILQKPDGAFTKLFAGEVTLSPKPFK